MQCTCTYFVRKDGRVASPTAGYLGYVAEYSGSKLESREHESTVCDT